MPQRRAPSSDGVARVLAVWVAGFSIGTIFHVIELLTQGSAVYGNMPDFVRVFWVSLTIVDPLVVILILLRLRAGIVLGGTVMVADVAVKLQELKERYSAEGGRITHLDGISVDFDDWHFNVRPSNTEPLLRLCLESLVSEQDMERRRDEVLGLIRS